MFQEKKKKNRRGERRGEDSCEVATGGKQGLKMKDVVEESTDLSHISSLLITAHSYVKLHFLLGSV